MKKVIEKIESGKQVGVEKIIKCGNAEIFYTYAVQKVSDKYIVYESIYDSKSVWEDTEENIFYYNSLFEFENNINAKYDIKLEDLDVSKGQKFFNVNLYI